MLHQRKANTFLLSPGPLLEDIPLGSLPVGYLNGQNMLETFYLGAAPSASITLKCRKRATETAISPGVLVIADPSEKSPWAGVEADMIQSMYPEAIVKFVHETDTQEVLLLMEQHDILHFACHGEFCYEKGNFVAGIQLRDGLLSFEDVWVHCDFPRRPLVILSACRTGKIVPTLSSEYFFSLSGMFLQAGAYCVVGSLWQTDDLATALLMWQFHRHLRLSRYSVAESLVKAQHFVRTLDREGLLTTLQAWRQRLATDEHQDMVRRSLRGWGASDVRGRDASDRTAQEFADPYYWAGFQAIGWALHRYEAGDEPPVVLSGNASLRTEGDDPDGEM